MDMPTLLAVAFVGTLLNAIILYFVIKAAVKGALSEDRLFQAKLAKARAAGEGVPRQRTS